MARHAINVKDAASTIRVARLYSNPCRVGIDYQHIFRVSQEPLSVFLRQLFANQVRCASKLDIDVDCMASVLASDKEEVENSN